MSSVVIYSYRVGVLTPEAIDLTGFDVGAIDPSPGREGLGGSGTADVHIGKVDEATYETESSYIIVDTGFWIFGKKRMIPAAVIERVDLDERTVYVRMTKDEIKAAPDYDPDRHRRDQDDYREEQGSYYSPWSS